MRGKWGGPRKGAGRPTLAEETRKNRVAIMLRDDELVALRRLAERDDVPLSTAAYELVARGLKRLK
jgi:hypothetical protein